MTTLGEARDILRTQLDLDTDDVSDAQATLFVREGFNRTFSAERQWPFFQTQWNMTLLGGQSQIDMTIDASDMGQIVSFLNVTTGTKLVQIPEQYGEENYQGTSTTSTSDPLLYSVWGDKISFWPGIVDSLVDRPFKARGYRMPVWTGVDTDELDGDDRLHPAIIWHACSLAYAQLEDPELETMYLQRWQQSMEDLRQDMMRPQHHTPLILNGGVSSMIVGSRNSVSLNWEDA